MIFPLHTIISLSKMEVYFLVFTVKDDRDTCKATFIFCLKCLQPKFPFAHFCTSS